MKIIYYFETIAAIGLKVGLYKLNGYQRSRSLFDLGHRSLRFQNLNLFCWETIKSFGTKFHLKAYG